MTKRKIVSAVLAGSLLLGTACGGSDGDAAPEATGGAETVGTTGDAEAAQDGGIRIVSPLEASAIIEDAPEDLVVLDVRAPDEFAEGHIEGAKLVNFYDGDFEAQLAELDPDVPYVLYCRSGNRSGQTRVIMEGLGFADVADVDGGTLAWEADGLSLTAG